MNNKIENNTPKSKGKNKNKIKTEREKLCAQRSFSSSGTQENHLITVPRYPRTSPTVSNSTAISSGISIL